ncbi:ubiquitin thioesterase otulin isoform X2 [Lissotriton helveticus]
MSPREQRNRRKGKRGGGRGVRNSNSSRDGLVKHPSKEESVKLVEEQQEGTHQLDPEFLTCARHTPSSAIKEAKEQNSEGVHPIKGVFPENVPAPVVNSNNGWRKSTTEEEAIAHKAHSSQEAQIASPCLTSHIPPANHKRCSADGPQNHSPGQPKRPPRGTKAVSRTEDAEGTEKQKSPASDDEHTSKDYKPQRDISSASRKSRSDKEVQHALENNQPDCDVPHVAKNIEPARELASRKKEHDKDIEDEVKPIETMPMQPAAVSEAKGRKQSSGIPVAGDNCEEKICSSGLSAEKEQEIDSEEDIYRDEEEIEKEGGKKGPEESNKVGLAPEMDIMEYCHKEWRGQTAVTNLMKKGYEAVSQDFTSIRRVRGDNYCALRALLFQAMSQTTELPPWLQNPDLIEMPAKLISTYDWIKQWKLRYSFDEEQMNPHLEQIRQNLELLKEKWQTLSEIDIPADKQAACDDVFQNEHEAYCLYEAVKFLMLSKAIDLYNDNLEGKEVPMFSWLLFARNTSSNPQEFMENHLNQVGYTGGLEQVEMFLLGYTVQHTIKVYRLYKHDTDEFITLYPNDQEDWPVVSLITEDDRHYNVPVGILQTQELET